MSEPTVREMQDKLIVYCERQTDCEQCVLRNHDVCDKYNPLDAPENIIRDAYNKIHPPEPVEEVPTEMVDHPNHYNREGAMECIDEMITLFGVEVVKHFCLCNAWKYRYRSNQKNGEEDIKKSDWYIQKYKELCS